ncbi:MAG: hypothetical protein OXR66_08300 [Candidatus Woesearchaeota archaeon]|nr:hypothetical protein [Candidatus Woesearchaeota archaeon]
MRRGQAALEFIMTYGWAILAVLAAIAALAYFGVLNPAAYLPNKCTVSPEFGCIDFQLTQWTAEGEAADVDDGEVKVRLVNNVGVPVNITNINLTHSGTWRDGTPPSGPFCPMRYTYDSWVNDEHSIIVGAGDEFEFNCNPRQQYLVGWDGVGTYGKVDFTITYIKSGKVYEHKARGEVRSEVIEQVDHLP